MDIDDDPHDGPTTDSEESASPDLSEEEAQDIPVEIDSVSPLPSVPDKKPQKKARAPLTQGGLVKFGSVTIDLDKPLPDLDRGEVRAYYAEVANKGGHNFFALVCEPHLPPRYKKTTVYEGTMNPNLCSLFKHGVIQWPPSGGERYAFVYQDNLGKRLLSATAAKQAVGLRSDVVIDRILRPLVGILQDFRNRDFRHGAISPDNIFDGGMKTLEQVVLGDCLSRPSYNSHVLYETIERGMAEPLGRGAGMWSDDIYALGASVAVLIRSHDPTEGFSDEDIVRMKMDAGSYITLAGRDRFTGSILDFLRGTLHDDPEHRWGVDEILGWLDGQRLSPKQVSKKYKAIRPIGFNGNKYLYPSFLALDLAKNPAEARRIIEDGNLENWLTRSIDKNTIFERVEEAVLKTQEIGQGKEYEERLVANLSTALHPEAPVRYMGRRLFPDGLGSLLADAFVKNKDLNVFSDLIAHNIVMNWIRVQDSVGLDIGSLLSRFDASRSFLRQDKLGFGLERCLYFLNPEARCLSPKLLDYWVISSEDMLTAFEDLCSKKKAPGVFLDRHCIAFLAVRDSKILDSYLPDLRSGEHHRTLLAQLQCLASIQKRYKLKSLPHVAETFLGMLSVLYKRVHDKKRRERIEANVTRFAQAGDLVRMSDVLSNQDVVVKDLSQFKVAMREYLTLSQELKNLDARLEKKDDFGKVAGREASAVVSSIIAGIIMLAIGVMYLSNKSVF